MANCISFKVVVVLGLVGAVILFCDAKPTLKRPYTPSPVVQVARDLTAQRSYTYTINFRNSRPDLVKQAITTKGITYIDVDPPTKRTVKVNILQRNYNSFQQLIAEKKGVWTVTLEKSKKIK